MHEAFVDFNAGRAALPCKWSQDLIFPDGRCMRATLRPLAGFIAGRRNVMAARCEQPRMTKYRSEDEQSIGERGVL
jgi:hypothetical protein